MSILCSMVGATFGVAAVAEILRSKKGMVQVGTAQISTTQSKFGGSSLYASSTSSRVQGYQDVSQTGDFTVEFWAYLPGTGSYNGFVDLGSEASGRVAFGVNAGKLYINIYGGADVFTGSGTVSTNTWSHIAFVRSGTTITGYLNGVSQGTYGPNGGTFGNTGGFALMGYINNGSGGYGDEFRISKIARYTANFTAPTAPFVNDDNTVLLFHANGTNTSTFFEDDNGVRASTALVSSGVTTSTTQTKFGGTSAYFDGTGSDHIYGNEAANLGSGDFTVEFWIYPYTNTSGASNGVVTKRVVDNVGAGSWGIRWADSGTRTVVWENIISPVTTITSSGNPFNYNVWSHWAFVRSGSTLTIYVNGVNVGSGSNSINFTNTNPLRIGWWGTGTTTIGAYLDEVRISNIARYTANFTAPTQPFVNDSNTTFLMHADGTNGQSVFRDDNGYSQRTAKHISYYGNAQIDTAQSKFGGSSALFDGAGDYLSVIPNTDFILGTNNWTVEYWIRHSSQAACAHIDSRASSGDNGITLYYTGSAITYYTGGSIRITGPSLSNNTWYHIALVRNGNDHKLYVDGTQVGSTWTSSQSITSVSSGVNIGAASDNPGNIGTPGWIDEVRISNSARYTANFTAPTAPFVNDANTLLLLHIDSTDASTIFVDDNGGRTQKSVQAIGNAQVDTAQSKFNGTSAYFDGTGDYLTVGSTGDFQFAPGSDVTMECWFRIDSTLSGEFNGIFSLGTTRGSSSNEWSCFLMQNSATGFNIRAQMGHNYNVLIGSTTNLSVNQWYHLAMTRSGTTFTMWIDGVSQGTYTGTLTLGQNTGAKIASLPDGTLFHKGWIDEVRISNTARYTANFTPSTTPFQNDANTLLLLHMDGSDASTQFFDDNGQIPKTA